jgi:hypothetical protein
MPHEFDQTAVAYREARSQCQVATGDALDTAQDLEAVAVEGLINTPTDHLGEINDKLGALADLMQLGRWSDGRDARPSLPASGGTWPVGCCEISL